MDDSTSGRRTGCSKQPAELMACLREQPGPQRAPKHGSPSGGSHDAIHKAPCPQHARQPHHGALWTLQMGCRSTTWPTRQIAGQITDDHRSPGGSGRAPLQSKQAACKAAAPMQAVCTASDHVMQQPPLPHTLMRGGPDLPQHLPPAARGQPGPAQLPQPGPGGPGRWPARPAAPPPTGCPRSSGCLPSPGPLQHHRSCPHNLASCPSQPFCSAGRTSHGRRGRLSTQAALALHPPMQASLERPPEAPLGLHPPSASHVGGLAGRAHLGAW